jgi:hypothetical protein
VHPHFSAEFAPFCGNRDCAARLHIAHVSRMRRIDARPQRRDLPLRIEVLLGWHELHVHRGLPLHERL